MTPAMDEDIRRYRDVLRHLIERSGKPHRTIEDQLGWSRGAVSKLLSGTNELRVRQLLEILQNLGVGPMIFYRLVYGDTLSERILEELSASGDEEQPVVLPPAMSASEFDRRIEEAVTAALRREDRKLPG